MDDLLDLDKPVVSLRARFEELRTKARMRRPASEIRPLMQELGNDVCALYVERGSPSLFDQEFLENRGVSPNTPEFFHQMHAIEKVLDVFEPLCLDFGTECEDDETGYI